MKKFILFFSIFLVGLLGSFYPILIGESTFLPGDKKNFDFLQYEKEIAEFLKVKKLKLAPFEIFNVSESGGVNFLKEDAGIIEIFVYGEDSQGEKKYFKLSFGPFRYMRETTRGGGVATDYSFFYLGMTKSELKNPSSQSFYPWPECHFRCAIKKQSLSKASLYSIKSIQLIKL